VAIATTGATVSCARAAAGARRFVNLFDEPLDPLSLTERPYQLEFGDPQCPIDVAATAFGSADG
jgi:hypothetical protein